MEDPISISLVVKDMQLSSGTESIDEVDGKGFRFKRVVSSTITLTFKCEVEDATDLQAFYTRVNTANTPRVIVTI